MGGRYPARPPHEHLTGLEKYLSFSFTNPKPNNEPSFSFTGPNPADLDEQLQAIADMAHEILRLVAEVRGQISN
ncbi:hypothetical protein BGK67_09880 [Streptomyces subrutilus]|uniref:Uncharacterized protein n=1 Tax=Streptomyces subrutilus TaxID=36818 RepID=A0A1E5PPX4_9ACTN|nr:hypothetical protein BGK67_09880 [Streptomyces subrutilus]